MRKNVYITRKSKAYQRHPATVLLWCGAPPILFSLLAISDTIAKARPLTAAAATYYGKMLEYPLAAITILSLGLFVIFLAERKR